MKRTNEMVVKVYRTDTETADVKLVRIYPCHHVFNTIDNSSLHCLFIDYDGAEIDMEVEYSSWMNEHIMITTA